MNINKQVYFPIASLLLFLFLSSCGDNSGQPTSNQEMVEELRQLKEVAKQSGNYAYFADFNVKRFGDRIKGMSDRIQTSYRLEYYLMLMLKGDNDACITGINNYLKANNITEVNKANASYFRVLALAYIRKGEITNCIKHHSGESCILPLQGGGIHQEKAPMQAAIQTYLKILSFNPNDWQSRWFLNLAYMATDQYPDQVPEKWRIPAQAFESDTSFKRFQNISMELGVATNNHAGGSSIEDFNNDGFLDIFTTSYSLADPSKLYLNDGKGNFQDQTDVFGLSGYTAGLNNIHADFNGDGFTDIFITRGAWLRKNGAFPNSLLINKQGKGFEDQTKKAGLYTKRPTGVAAAADIDLDGKLDLFVGNEGGRDPYPSEMYLNNGDGTFSDQAKAVGLTVDGFVKGATWGDVNQDGWPDLFVSIYSGWNRLYIHQGLNEQGLPSFKEVARNAGVAAPKFSFPCWFWDYDNDGLEDIFVSGYDNNQPYFITDEVLKNYLDMPFRGETPRLYKNNGDGTFSDQTAATGLAKLLVAMGGNFGDFNNDGFPDFYLGTGEFNIWASVPNRAFLNQEGKQFLDVTTAGNLGQIQKGHGVAFGDLDNDGDQDIYHQVGGAAESDVFQNMLLENPGFGQHWISIQLEGTTANRSAIGAWIEIMVMENNEVRSIYHRVNTGGSFGANSLRAEIGLGEAEKIISISITWPNKAQSSQLFEAVDIDQHYFLREGEVLKKRVLKSIHFDKSGHHQHVQ